MKRYLILCFLCCIFQTSYSQLFTDSNLPVVIINTDGNAEIPDSPRVLGNMKIIYRGEGLRNYLTDQNTPGYLNYNGRINIELRGSSSQYLDKKQYGFSTLMNDNITNNNISLLGMPADNDWILNGLGFEPGLIRDYLCYNLSRMIGEYASRTAYCEVILNGSYNGLYVLQEKIKQGSERVNVSKIETTDVTYPKITGGYIVKADKTTGNDPVAWYMSSYYGKDNIGYLMDYPKPEYVTVQQSTYIHSEFTKLATMSLAQNSSPDIGYPSVIDVPSFVDFMILNELGSNADAYTYSTFFHKDRNGKLRAGPIWDLNLTFGYDLAIWGYDRSHPNVWQFSDGDNEGARFWRDLFDNPVFRCCLNRRWTQLTQPGEPLNYNSIIAFIDKTVATISEAAVRENQRWGTVPDLTSEINKIKNFLGVRIPWITNAIKPTANCPNVILPPLVITKIMYHPDSTLKFPDSDQQEFIEIKNTGPATVSLSGVYFSGTGFVYQFPVYSEIMPGATKIIAGNSEIFREKYGQAPFGQFTRNLSDKKEKLVLADAFGNVIDSVSYFDHSPWPDADGNGYYLDLADPLSDNSLPSNWTASTNIVISSPEIEFNKAYKIFPTPVKDNLTIESTGNVKSLELFDFQGRRLRDIEINSTTYQLDMSSFTPGIYIIQLKSADGNFVQKIAKE
jgi:hypothetical protein